MSIDNIEQVGHKPSGSVTQVEGYNEAQEIGPVNDFSRDFHAVSRIVGINTIPGIREQLPASELDGSSASPDDMSSPNSAVGTPFDPVYMREIPASDFNTQQVAIIAGGAQRIAQAKGGRRSLVVMNLDATNYAYLGSNSGTVPTSGFPLVPGAVMPIFTAGDVWACSTADVMVAVLETTGFSS